MTRELTEFEKDFLYKGFAPCCDECDYVVRDAIEQIGLLRLRGRHFRKCIKLDIELTHDISNTSATPCKLLQFRHTLWIEYSLNLVFENGKLLVK